MGENGNPLTYFPTVPTPIPATDSPMGKKGYLPTYLQYLNFFFPCPPAGTQEVRYFGQHYFSGVGKFLFFFPPCFYDSFLASPIIIVFLSLKPWHSLNLTSLIPIPLGFQYLARIWSENFQCLCLNSGSEYWPHPKGSCIPSSVPFLQVS